MNQEKKDWKPDLDEDALKALIRATIMNAGPIDPSLLPSKVRERIKGRATGDLDVEAYIRQVLRETKKD
ncbi:MAG: hypothetical protein AAFW81_07100 [Pseudomonadota bacterium]